MYAPAAENLEYIKKVTAESGFYKYIKFQHEILKASWTDEEAMWTLSIKNLETGSTLDNKVHVFLELNGPVRYHSVSSRQYIRSADHFPVLPG